MCLFAGPAPRQKKRREDIKRQIVESKNKLMKAVGKESYNNVNLFENVEPMSENNSHQSPLSGVGSKDTGVDITKIPGAANWKALARGK